MSQIGGIKGSGRESHVELNLVPFIDLMSVCIIFLLITAVWTQVSMIQLGSSVYSQKNSDEVIAIPELAEIVLRVDVQNKGFRLVIKKAHIFIPKLKSEYDKQALTKRLIAIKKQYPSKTDAVVSIQDAVQYKYLIQAMDAFLLAGFPQIAIATIGVK